MNYPKQKEIEQYIYDFVSDFEGTDAEGLHFNLFNSDYFIIGTYQAKQWMGAEAFDIIEIVKEYEEEMFGEVNTDLSDPEKVVNMYAYIVGEYVLNDIAENIEESGEFTGKLTAEKIADIQEYLK